MQSFSEKMKGKAIITSFSSEIVVIIYKFDNYVVYGFYKFRFENIRLLFFINHSKIEWITGGIQFLGKRKRIYAMKIESTIAEMF